MEIIQIEGELTLFRVPEFKATMEDLIKNHIYHIQLDLLKCRFVDSSGISLIINMNNRLKKFGGCLRVINKPASLKNVMILAGLPENFEREY